MGRGVATEHSDCSERLRAAPGGSSYSALARTRCIAPGESASKFPIASAILKEADFGCIESAATANRP